MIQPTIKLKSQKYVNTLLHLCCTSREISAKRGAAVGITRFSDDNIALRKATACSKYSSCEKFK